MSVEQIFPTIIYNVVIENVEEVQSEISAVINDVLFERSEKLFGHANQIAMSPIDAMLHYNLTKTTEMINRHLTNYIGFLNFGFKPYSVYSWFTKNKPGDYLQVHHHNAVDITGTYYYQTPTDCGDFFFDSPVTAAPHSTCYARSHLRKYYTPEVGRLILFPGWINHGVLKNTSTSDRIGLSFNISFAK